MNIRRRFRVVELYAGTARSVQPFRRWPQSRISALIDFDEYAAETYLANVPDAPYYTRDLTNIRASTIERLAGGKVDILLGCPPCQGFSETGTRNPRDLRNAHFH